MVQEGTLDVEMLAAPYTRVAGAGAGGGRNEELAARWAEIPNEVIAVSVFPGVVWMCILTLAIASGSDETGADGTGIANSKPNSSDNRGACA